MRFAMLVYEPPDNFRERKDGREGPYVAAWRAYYQALMAAGVYEGGSPLKEAGTATTVRVKQGKRFVQDGPFPEAKEQLGGFFVLELPSLDAALERAARCPAAASGALEVRPIDDTLYEDVVGD